MEAIRKQASKLREQVARQQQVGLYLSDHLLIHSYIYISSILNWFYASTLNLHFLVLLLFLVEILNFEFLGIRKD